MARTIVTDPGADLREVFRRITRQAAERERRDEPLEVRELRRLAPNSPVLRFFARAKS